MGLEIEIVKDYHVFVQQWKEFVLYLKEHAPERLDLLHEVMDLYAERTRKFVRDIKK